MQDDEIIFMLTPHVVRATDISPLNLQEIDTGTGTNVELRRISAPAIEQMDRRVGRMDCRRGCSHMPRRRPLVRRRPAAATPGPAKHQDRQHQGQQRQDLHQVQ